MNALEQALLVAVTLRHQGRYPCTVHLRIPGPAMLHHSLHWHWASATSPLIYLHHSTWTLVLGRSLGNLYNSPSLGLKGPSYKHLHKTGINEITAEYEKQHSSYTKMAINWLAFSVVRALVSTREGS